MLLSHRFMLLLAMSLPVLSACGSSSHGSESGTITPTGVGVTMPTVPVTPPKAGPVGEGVAGTDDKVSATASVDTLNVALGAAQSITITFTSNDGMPITGFSVYGSLGNLPAGWSSPSSLTCAIVAPGSGCALTLIYTPTVIETGTLTLECVYVDNAGLPRTPGPCLTLAYSATASNNVAASISPSGEIDATSGGRQAVTIDFTTDDGNAATALTLSTAGLPTGWSSQLAGLSCAVVSTGNGCHLPLTFAPTGAAAGTLALGYTYTDGTGAPRTGSVNIPYVTTPREALVAAVSPNGQINAALTGGKQNVAVTFTTADGNTATDLRLTSDLTKLPAGWSSPSITAASSVFGCDSVSAGNGCQLQLAFAPTALGGGTLTLRYSYTDSVGLPNFGLVTIPYAATTNDNVAGTVSPTGQIVAMLGSPAQTITVSFTTDDGRLATGLQAANIGTLPAGWTSASGTFGCSVLGSGGPCQLLLTYAPTGVDNGTLTLNYSYVNNAAESKSGTVSIDYRTTTNDNVVAAAAPVSVAAVTGSTSNPVNVVFTTDDGNTANSFAADLSTLAPEWTSSVGMLSCATVSVGASCQVSLNYAPTVAANSTLTFGYSYVNSAGTAKTGTVSIPYTAAP